MAIDTTVGGVNANSFGSVSEADTYFNEERLPLPVTLWDDFDNKEIALIMATRALVTFLKPRRILVKETNDCCAYYLINRTWTGSPSTTTQALPFPRIGMYDSNGNLIPDNIIPMDLKRAEFELAGRLGQADLTLDNDISIQGITSVKVGSIAVAFKDNVKAMNLIPEYVMDLLPSSWITDELIEDLCRPEINFL